MIGRKDLRDRIKLIETNKNASGNEKKRTECVFFPEFVVRCLGRR
jgi:hypothetical protein